MRRLEETYFDARNYYTKEAAEQYDKNSRINFIQREMTLRALEFLDIKKGKVLDAGCGTGISVSVLKESGFDAVGIDISEPMIKIAKKKKLKCEIGDFHKLRFKDNFFDGIISISAIQWNPVTPASRHSGWNPAKNVNEAKQNYLKVAKEFYRVLKKNRKAVVQFYSKNKFDLEYILEAFKVFDKVTLAIDGENTKNEKKYLILEKV